MAHFFHVSPGQDHSVAQPVAIIGQQDYAGSVLEERQYVGLIVVGAFPNVEGS